MNTLIVRHQGGGNEGERFVVQLLDGDQAPPVEVPAPNTVRVEGRPKSTLLGELRWYLEEFLSYPFSPETEHAERVLAALEQWGQRAFEALFDRGETAVMLAEARRGGDEQLLLQVRSEDPEVLSWPWEALRDPKLGALAPACQIERRLNARLSPPPIDAELPKNGVNILLVTARPYEGDVQYRSISRPLVELVERYELAVKVHVLRPPTFDALEGHLKEHRNVYHLLHFDGHGGYGPANEIPDGEMHRLRGREGQLVFEKADGSPDLVSAEKLGTLLREYRIPAVVLNACQSGMLDGEAKDPFASVAVALLRAGARSVTAMAYSLYVSGAEQFLPAFYAALFETGSPGEATRAGRRKMFQKRGRVCARGRFDLEDWLVPVLYQQEAWRLPFASGTLRAKAPEPPSSDQPHGFIGRDGAVLAIERALRRPAPAILVQGLGGVGKTTLAQGIVKWLEQTGGIDGAMWFSFQEIHSSEYVLNRMGEALYGGDFGVTAREEKVELLAKRLRTTRQLVVWDNFEVVAGAGGESARLPEEDRQELRALLQKLRGAPSKVLITSRSEEAWLGPERWKLDLGGLQGEEQWVYAEAVLGNLGIRIDRKDKDLVELMKLLGGHPLMMRVVLARLAKQTPLALMEALRTNVTVFRSGHDEAEARLFATLRLAEDAVPDLLKPLLFPLALHEQYVLGGLLEGIAEQVDASWTRERVEGFLNALVIGGLLADRGQTVYEMHPALSGYLLIGQRAQDGVGNRETWERAFVDVMAQLADQIARKKPHEQHGWFAVLGESFRGALDLAARWSLPVAEAALLDLFGAYALNCRRYQESQRWYERLGLHRETHGDLAGVAVAYHELGIIAAAQRDYEGAKGWCAKSLAIEEKHGNEDGAASTYHQLGIIAAEQRDYEGAKAWYGMSLAIFEKRGNEDGAASTYHQLGIIAAAQRDYEGAKGWCEKSLAIEEKRGNEHEAASTYHQLGNIAAEQGDYEGAREWYGKSLAIFEKQWNEDGMASTYHHLGIIAAEQGDYEGARGWYGKSVVIFEKQRNADGAARTYHELGIVAAEQGDYEGAKGWYEKSLAIEGNQGNEHEAASTYHQLGNIAAEQGDYEGAKGWHEKSLAIAEKQGNEDGAASAYHQLGNIAEAQGDYEGAKGWYGKSLAIAEKQGNKRWAAFMYHQVGRVAAKQGDYEGAKGWYGKSLAIAEKQGNKRVAALTYAQFGLLEAVGVRFERAAGWLVRAAVGFRTCGDIDNARHVAYLFARALQNASPEDQATMSELWGAANLGNLPKLSHEES